MMSPEQKRTGRSHPLRRTQSDMYIILYECSIIAKYISLYWSI